MESKIAKLKRLTRIGERRRSDSELFIMKNTNETKKLSGTLWGIVTYFNPQGYRNKLENFKKFRISSKQQRLSLLAVELAFFDAPFELSAHDADIIKQVRANSVLWQKERLLNIALEALPLECDKIVWLDGDILFSNDEWVNETAQKLEQFQVVQPFDFAVRLPKGVVTLDVDKLEEGNDLAQRQPSAAYHVSKGIKHYGHSGYAWSARREVFQGLGFFDKLIIGSGDNLISDAFCIAAGIKPSGVYPYLFGSLQSEALACQSAISERVSGNVGYVPGAIFHLFHGSRKDRSYHERLNVLRKYDFNFNQDIKLNPDDCWEWSSSKKKLHNWVYHYFWYRNEESSWLRSQWIRFLRAFRLLIS